MYKLGDVLSKEVHCNSNVSLTGIWGPNPSRRRLWRSGGEVLSGRAIFCDFLKKKPALTPLDHISHVFRAPFECTGFLTFESHLKELSCSVLLLLAI